MRSGKVEKKKVPTFPVNHGAMTPAEYGGSNNDQRLGEPMKSNAPFVLGDRCKSDIEWR